MHVKIYILKLLKINAEVKFFMKTKLNPRQAVSSLLILPLENAIFSEMSFHYQDSSWQAVIR